jgi:hypothetical protein
MSVLPMTLSSDEQLALYLADLGRRIAEDVCTAATILRLRHDEAAEAREQIVVSLPDAEQFAITMTLSRGKDNSA